LERDIETIINDYSVEADPTGANALPPVFLNNVPAAFTLTVDVRTLTKMDLNSPVPGVAQLAGAVVELSSNVVTLNDYVDMPFPTPPALRDTSDVHTVSPDPAYVSVDASTISSRDIQLVAWSVFAVQTA